jgi:hypothetical protein
VILADPRFVNPDGSIWMKFPWWGVGVPHKLLSFAANDSMAPLVLLGLASSGPA